MNELDLNLCFESLATLQQNVQLVENVCNICGATHSTQNCPDFFRNGKHVRDTIYPNMSRSTVPTGIHIIDSESGSCVVSSQKFAKGSRFGPFLAKKSYIPVENVRLPLIIFGNPLYTPNNPEFQELFKIRNIYLDTSNENICNWMIHVTPARYSNEQNLMCFQLNDQIFYTAVQDIDVGDILKVWYAPKYAAKMNVELLIPSQFEIVNNIILQMSIDQSISLNSFAEDGQLTLENTLFVYEDEKKTTEVSLPPINSIMRSSQNFQNNNYLYTDCNSSNYEIENMYTRPTTPNQSNIDLLNSSGSMHHTADMNFSGGGTDFLNFSFNSSNFDGENDEDVAIRKESTPIRKKGKFDKKLSPYSCEVCAKSYVSLSSLNKHMVTHNLVLCNMCLKCFQTLDELKSHNCPKQVDLGKISRCNVCYKVLSNSWSLARHMKSTHKEFIENQENSEISTDDTNFKLIEQNSCSPSGSISSPTDALQNKDELRRCRICSKQFQNQVSLDRHLKNIHTVQTMPPLIKISPEAKKPPEEDEEIYCKKAPVKRDIAKALANKLTERSFRIKKEESVIIENSIISLNGGSHRVEGNIRLAEGLLERTDGENGILKKLTNTTCEICLKTFSKKDHLKKHKLTHENIYFQCPFCEHAPLKARNSLRRHFSNQHMNEQEKWESKGFINTLIVKNGCDELPVNKKIPKVPIDDEEEGNFKEEEVEEAGGDDENPKIILDVVLKKKPKKLTKKQNSCQRTKQINKKVKKSVPYTSSQKCDSSAKLKIISENSSSVQNLTDEHFLNDSLFLDTNFDGENTNENSLIDYSNSVLLTDDSPLFDLNQSSDNIY